MKTTETDYNVAIEILQDMYFVIKICQIQSRIEDIWLKDYYTKMAISYLAIVLHECLQAKLLDKRSLDKKAVNLLSRIRQRIVKLVPSDDSKSIKNIADTMGIDFDHYIFDLQIAIKKKKQNELYDIGFTYYDLLDGQEEKEIFNSLITIPFQIIDGVISKAPLNKCKEDILDLFQRIHSSIGNTVSDKISLHKYPYASGVFFKKTELGWNDKIMILYYYTLVKQASLLDCLVPDEIEQMVGLTDTINAKCKFRAIIIENIGQFLMKVSTPLAEELRLRIDKLMDKGFFSANRAVKNNIHYKRTSIYSRDYILDLYEQQGLYLDAVLAVFDSQIKYHVGWKYKIIRFIADKTDSTMIEIRRNNPKIKHLEDVSMKEWEEAKSRRAQKKKVHHSED